MKKIAICTICMTIMMASCKKKDAAPTTCDISVAGIAGNYKISKIEVVAAGVATDVTSTFLDACERDDIYQLKADKTVVYQDAGTACAPSSAGTGTWDVVSSKLTITHSGSGPDIATAAVNNKCSTVIAEESFGGGIYRTTFTKQ